MATLREQVAELEIRLDEAQRGLVAATREARAIAADFKEKQEDRYVTLQRKAGEISDERDWLRAQLASIVRRVAEVKPSEEPQYDQYGQPMFR